MNQFLRNQKYISILLFSTIILIVIAWYFGFYQALRMNYNNLLNSKKNIKSELNNNQRMAGKIHLLTEELNNTDPNGRVVIDLLNDSTLDLYGIKEGDELFIPEQNYVVYVYGEISSEGAVMYSENKDVEYFVEKSGGYKRFADNESIYILHPNGESQLYRSKRNIFESRPQSDIKIYPGSIIFVPRELDDSTPRRLAAQAYVSILGNLGIALASLSAIND